MNEKKMADINDTEKQAQEKELEIAHMKSFSKDGSLPFLELKEWGASSNGSGYTNFYVYNDGQFVKEEGEYSLSSITGEDKQVVMCIESHSTSYMGNLSNDKLGILKTYIDTNIVESKSQNMFDAGVSVTYFKNGKELVIENNTELFKNVTDLVPFKIQKES
jgi:hypothetical protein